MLWRWSACKWCCKLRTGPDLTLDGSVPLVTVVQASDRSCSDPKLSHAAGDSGAPMSTTPMASQEGSPQRPFAGGGSGRGHWAGAKGRDRPSAPEGSLTAKVWCGLLTSPPARAMLFAHRSHCWSCLSAMCCSTCSKLCTAIGSRRFAHEDSLAGEAGLACVLPSVKEGSQDTKSAGAAQQAAYGLCRHTLCSMPLELGCLGKCRPKKRPPVSTFDTPRGLSQHPHANSVPFMACSVFSDALRLKAGTQNDSVLSGVCCRCWPLLGKRRPTSRGCKCPTSPPWSLVRQVIPLAEYIWGHANVDQHEHSMQLVSH